MSERRLWIVEMLFSNVWKPTIGVPWSRDEARQELLRWKEIYPHDSFRIVDYVPATSAGKGGQDE